MQQTWGHPPALSPQTPKPSPLTHSWKEATPSHPACQGDEQTRRPEPVSGPRGSWVPHDPTHSHKTPTVSWNRPPPLTADRALEGNHLKYFWAK